jgi:hypothetical protein
MFEMYSGGHGYITTHQMQSLLAKLSRLGPDKIGQLQCECRYAVTYKTVFMSPSYYPTHKLLLHHSHYSLTITPLSLPHPSLSLSPFSSTVAFYILDQDNDGYVTEEDILHYLLITVTDKRAGLSRGQLEQIVKATVQHHDIDEDGRLNQLEFESLFS